MKKAPYFLRRSMAAVALCLLVGMGQYGCGLALPQASNLGAPANGNGNQIPVKVVFNANPVWAGVGPNPGFDAAESKINVSGRALSLAIGQNNTTLFVGTASGGVWKTTDGGKTYSPQSDALPSSAIGALAVDPSSNGQVIYAGTGENAFSGDQTYGLGMMKSTDGGSTFKQLPDPNFAFTLSAVSKIVVSKLNPNVVYATTVPASLFANHAIGVGNNKGGNTFLSTDGGQTFKGILNAAIGTLTAAPTTDLLLLKDSATQNQQVLLAGVDTTELVAQQGQAFIDNASGIYLSTDGGQTWAKQATGLPAGNTIGRIDLAAAPNNANIVYALIASLESGLTGNPTTFLGLFGSADNGKTWVNVANQTAFTDKNAGVGNNGGDFQSNYNMELIVDPNNNQRVYLGGLTTARLDGINLSVVNNVTTQTGNATTTIIGLNSPPSPIQDDANHPHTDQHFLAIDGNGSLYTASDGGVWRLDNPTQPTGPGNAVWVDLNGNLQTLQFYSCALDPVANIALGGTQDNGTFRLDGTSSIWREINGGDGGFARIDQTSANFVYATTPFGVGFLTQYTDGGAAAVTVDPNTGNVVFPPTAHEADSGINFADTAEFFAPFVISPKDHNRMCLGTNRVYETTNATTTTQWNDVSGQLRNATDATEHVTAIAYAPSDVGFIYAGLRSGQVFVRQTSGGAFTNNSTGLPARLVSYLAVDPANASHAYATIGSFTPQNNVVTPGKVGVGGLVFETTNAGQQWTDISNNLPNFPAVSIVVDPTFPGTLYLGTDVGVFVTTNDGKQWNLYGTGQPSTRCGELALSPKGVLANNTHGRSCFEASTNSNATVVVLPAIQPTKRPNFAPGVNPGGVRRATPRLPRR